jgi:hypothetical protein
VICTLHRAHSRLALALAKQLRQPRDVDGDAPRLVLRQHLGLQRFGFTVSGIDVRERLPVGIADDIAAGWSSADRASGRTHRYPSIAAGAGCELLHVGFLRGRVR